MAEGGLDEHASWRCCNSKFCPPEGCSNGCARDHAIYALRDWHKMQSMGNTSRLYNAASKLFGSKFDPTEYDSVE